MEWKSYKDKKESVIKLKNIIWYNIMNSKYIKSK